jgi:outer membrane protein assembly factor BamB
VALASGPSTWVWRSLRKVSEGILADGKICLTTRVGNVLVFTASPEYELLATNSFDSEGSDFSGTPAIVGNKLLIRSNRFLYCVGD